MRIFGFTIRAKREPRWASHQDLTPLYQGLQTLDQRLTQLEGKVEATRVRVYQKAKQNGDQDQDRQPAAQEQEQPPVVLRAGDDPSIIFGR